MKHYTQKQLNDLADKTSGFIRALSGRSTMEAKRSPEDNGSEEVRRVRQLEGDRFYNHQCFTKLAIALNMGGERTDEVVDKAITLLRDAKLI